jgi:hypothetical protein
MMLVYRQMRQVSMPLMVQRNRPVVDQQAEDFEFELGWA